MGQLDQLANHHADGLQPLEVLALVISCDHLLGQMIATIVLTEGEEAKVGLK